MNRYKVAGLLASLALTVVLVVSLVAVAVEKVSRADEYGQAAMILFFYFSLLAIVWTAVMSADQ